SEATVIREVDQDTRAVILRFRDAAGVTWIRGPEGDLMDLSAPFKGNGAEGGSASRLSPSTEQPPDKWRTAHSSLMSLIFATRPLYPPLMMRALAAPNFSSSSAPEARMAARRSNPAVNPCPEGPDASAGPAAAARALNCTASARASPHESRLPVKVRPQHSPADRPRTPGTPVGCHPRPSRLRTGSTAPSNHDQHAQRR